jgi:hypothetical protein
MRTINDTIKRVLIWRFTLVLIKINYGQIGNQTGLFYTTNPVFYTSGNRFVRRTGKFGNLTFPLVPSDNRNTRSPCPWIQDGADGHNFERDPHRGHPCQVWFNLVQRFQRRRLFIKICLICPNLNCISIMMSFLTYITGFFMNFELLPILTDYAN